MSWQKSSSGTGFSGPTGSPAKEAIPDDVLIEKTLVHLDMEDIDRLFEVFSRSVVRKVWVERMIPDDRLHSMNLLFAYLFFGISKPEEYLKRKRREHFRKLEGLWKD